MSSRKCRIEFFDQLVEGKNAYGNEAVHQNLDTTHLTEPKVTASASCNGEILRLKFELQLDVAKIRAHEVDYLHAIRQFTNLLEHAIEHSRLGNYLK